MSKSRKLADLDELPQHLLDALIEKTKAHTAVTVANLKKHPDRHEHAKLVKQGLASYHDPREGFTFPSEATNIIGSLEPDDFRGGRNRNRRNRNQGNQGGNGGRSQGSPKGKSKGKTGGGGSGPKVMDPKVVLAAVQQHFVNLPYAGMTGNLQIGDFNGEFLDDTKYRFYADSYKELLTHFHVQLLSEIDPNIKPEIEKIPGYKFFPSQANTRHQAVGIAVNTNRLEVVGGPTIYNSVANVQGIPDLRPALRLDLRDKVTNVTFSVVVLHLKSMRGGPAVSGVVRRKQFALLVQDLGPDFAGFCGGDLNYIINDKSLTDPQPMFNAGFVLVEPNDTQATHSGGSRLDGLFYRGLTVGVDFYRVFAVFSQIGRTWSDHAPTKVELLVVSKVSNESTKGGGTVASDSGSGASPAAADDATDEQPIKFRAYPASKKGGARRKQ